MALLKEERKKKNSIQLTKFVAVDLFDNTQTAAFTMIFFVMVICCQFNMS